MKEVSCQIYNNNAAFRQELLLFGACIFLLNLSEIYARVLLT